MKTFSSAQPKKQTQSNPPMSPPTHFHILTISPILTQNHPRPADDFHKFSHFQTLIPAMFHPFFSVFSKLFKRFHTLSNVSKFPTPILGPKSRVTLRLSKYPTHFSPKNPPN
jgi:hypothetical protein